MLEDFIYFFMMIICGLTIITALTHVWIMIFNTCT